jgi:hypothetical protein
MGIFEKKTTVRWIMLVALLVILMGQNTPYINILVSPWAASVISIYCLYFLIFNARQLQIVVYVMLILLVVSVVWFPQRYAETIGNIYFYLVLYVALQRVFN